MKYVDEFRDPQAARRLLADIAGAAADQPPRKFMEVCGGHTHAIYRHGIEALLPASIELIHGPGCPVCVIPMGRVDDAIAVACADGVTMCCFGDMLRVPGGESTLLEAKARGADVRIVYSPLDALALAERLGDRQVVFLAVGFETTAPSTAVTLLQARERGVENFSVFCNHVTIVPPLKAILDSPGLDLDGFLGPGHVSTVIGTRPYRFVPEQYGRPLVTAGFEPVDILQSVLMLLRQLSEGRCEVENQYRRVVSGDGNDRALALLREVFVVRPHFEWRGLGFIARSARASGHIPGSRPAPPIPSTNDRVYATSTGRPARSDAASGAAVSTSAANTRVSGRSARTAVAIPHESPPPPKGTTTARTSGRSSTISSPMVPLPAITAGSLTGWTKNPSSPGWPCSRRTAHHSANGTGTAVAPSRAMASSLAAGAVSGTITRHGIPRRRASYATPWAMLPALPV